MARGRKSASYAPEMASGVAPSTGGVSSSNKQIPLLCNVCPDAPRFSDVSHLLTHIASKGHLHHETQTKLRAHQDHAASIALRSYEDWYSQNGIEALLVERMKTKQLKEAARTRRNRSLLSSSANGVKRKPRRTTSNSVTIKAEDDDEVAPEYPIYTGLLNSEDDVEALVDNLPTADMLSLKGQIWPGMGKMDLANEEMKRTRNQRKPKSVIEKMKRASEGIEPTQVIMTPEFEVERVKGVYDESSSPAPGQEEFTPPRKTTRSKRRKPEPLAEISANVPKQRRTNTRGTKSQVARKTSDKFKSEMDENSVTTLSLEQFRSNQDVFRDDGGSQGSIENQRFLRSIRNDQRFGLHSRFSAMPPLNPISHASLASPTPPSRELSSRMFGLRDESRIRAQPQTYLGSFGQTEASYAMKDATIYNASSRIPLATSSQFIGIGHEPFGLSHDSVQPKQEGYSHQNPGDHLQRTNGSQFINISATNPLYHDRLFLGSLNQTSRSPSIRSLAFVPINSPREQTQIACDSNNGSTNNETMKPGTQDNDVGETINFYNGKDVNFHGNWSLHSGSQDLELQNSLDPEDLRI